MVLYLFVLVCYNVSKGGGGIDQTFEVARSCKCVLARPPVGV